MSAAYSAIRPLIFRLQPEQIHHLTIAMLRLGGGQFLGRRLLRAWFQPRQPGPAVRAFGLTFKNPIGLAAGYDKDGLGWKGLACLGFGHLEIGTVTPLPQPGNPQPRVFRLADDQAVINRMGFPSRGAAFLAGRLKGPRPKDVVLGINIGKNKLTPLDQAVEDYLTLFETLAPLGDYLAVNVSSPNTPDLRKLQARQALESLLQPLAARRTDYKQATGKHVPLLVKLAPDLDDEELDQALEVILRNDMDGIIVHNTTITRSGVASELAAETGGLSGRPIAAMNLSMVKKVATRTNNRLPIIASGGIMDADGAQARLDSGASLIQLYTGLIYAGPGLVRDTLNRGLIVPSGG